MGITQAIKIYLFVNDVFWKTTYISESVPCLRIKAHHKKTGMVASPDGQPPSISSMMIDIAEFRPSCVNGLNNWKYDCDGDFSVDENQRLVAC